MDRNQVSKWNWDHRKKNGIDTSRRNGQLNKSAWPEGETAVFEMENKRVKK